MVIAVQRRKDVYDEMWREITAGHPTSSAEDARALAEGDDDIYFRYTPLPTPSNGIESSSVRHYEHQRHDIYQASQYRRIGSDHEDLRCVSRLYSLTEAGVRTNKEDDVVVVSRLMHAEEREREEKLYWAGVNGVRN